MGLASPCLCLPGSPRAIAIDNLVRFLRFWNGPSDHDAPKGDAFPPGNYQVGLASKAMVDRGHGRRPFLIQRIVPWMVTA